MRSFSHARVYQRLADAADRLGDERFRDGRVGIWYARAEVRRDFYCGLAAAKERGYNITRETLSATHVHLGNIDTEDAEMAFALMQGDYWSPVGTANEWLRSLGLDHTSMFVGDVIDINGQLLFVEVEGFSALSGA